MKQKIRQTVLKRRDGLPPEQRKDLDRKIMEKVKPYTEGKEVLSYQAFSSEPDLSPLDEGFHFAYPKVLGKGLMKACRSSVFEKSAYGIMEPSGGEEVLPEDLDVILVPLVCFDEDCHRLGHGGGYYDRFLKKTNALKIGIAYEIQKEKDIPLEEHDVCLDMVITEKKIYTKTGPR